MPSRVSSPHRLTRRAALFGAAAFAGGLAGAVRAAEGLHDAVARAAKRVAGGRASLTLLTPHGGEANVAPVTRAFAAAAGVDVRIRLAPVDEINTQLTLDALTGDGDYDLALPATFGLPDLALNRVIRPLTDFAARYEPPGFRDHILYSIGDSFDGDIYGFQTDGDAYVMFYQKDWLEDPVEAARYEDRFSEPLRLPLTWDELDRQMAWFHRPDEDRYGGALFRTPGYLAWEWWVRLHAKGVWPLSSEGEPQIASDAGVEALEDMIRASAHLYPQARSAGLFDNWAHYGEGRTYANIGWGGTQKYLNGPRSKMRGRMVFGPTPGGRIGGAVTPMPYFNWGWNYVVTTKSRQPELAYLFALYASTAAISTLSVREPEGYFDPFRPEHYSDPKIAEAYSPEFLGVHEASMRGAIPDLYLAGQSEYMRVLSEQLDQAVNGGRDPKRVLERAATKWALLNLREGKEAQRDRWLALRAKYPAAVRSALTDVA